MLLALTARELFDCAHTKTQHPADNSENVKRTIESQTGAIARSVLPSKLVKLHNKHDVSSLNLSNARSLMTTKKSLKTLATQ